MADDIWAPGTIVRLKSGGPPMMVERTMLGPQPSVICRWFDGPRPMRQRFAAALLDKLDV